MEQKYVKDSEGRLWRCQGKGSVGIFNGTEWVTMYPDGGGVLEGIIFDIMKDSDGNIWLASENGIGCYDGVNWTFYLPGEVLPQSKWGTLSVYTITQDHDGVIWFGTEIGIMNLNRNTWNFYDSEVTEIGSEHVYSSAVDNNNVKWFGFWRGGVARFDGENWINFTTKDGLCSNTVNDITVDHDGSIWFGTGNGISVLREDDTGVIESLDTLPEVLTLSKNYPNPFNPTTTIEFSLPSSGFTSFIIYNIMGQKVRELLADNLHHGTHSVVWDGKDDNGKPVSSGIYISMVRCGKHYAVQQMTHIK